KGKNQSPKAAQQFAASLSKLLRSNDAMFRKAYTDAKVDMRKVAGVLATVFDSIMQDAPTGRGAGEEVPRRRKPPPPLKPVKTYRLKPPFRSELASEQDFRGSFYFQTLALDKKTGSFAAALGSGDNYYGLRAGLLGDFIDVPAGVSRALVTAKIAAKYEY